MYYEDTQKIMLDTNHLFIQLVHLRRSWSFSLFISCIFPTSVVNYGLHPHTTPDCKSKPSK